jgi:hypothetical protein
MLDHFDQSFTQNKHQQEALDPFQAARAEKRAVPASFCCGEDWDRVEENVLGIIGPEKDLVHIPAMSLLKQTVLDSVTCNLRGTCERRCIAYLSILADMAREIDAQNLTSNVTRRTLITKKAQKCLTNQRWFKLSPDILDPPSNWFKQLKLRILSICIAPCVDRINFWHKAIILPMWKMPQL